METDEQDVLHVFMRVSKLGSDLNVLETLRTFSCTRLHANLWLGRRARRGGAPADHRENS